MITINIVWSVLGWKTCWLKEKRRAQIFEISQKVNYKKNKNTYFETIDFYHISNKREQKLTNLHI